MGHDKAVRTAALHQIAAVIYAGDFNMNSSIYFFLSRPFDLSTRVFVCYFDWPFARPLCLLSWVSLCFSLSLPN